MHDFFEVVLAATPRVKVKVIRPEWNSKRIKDLMIRGNKFYAVWDESNHIWSRDRDTVGDIVDAALWEYQNKIKDSDLTYKVADYKNTSLGTPKSFKSYIEDRGDIYHELDTNITFLNQKFEKTDYVSKVLDYELKAGSIDAYNELIGTLYNPEEREKIEWAIGSIVAGDSKSIQKFFVFYGPPGSGKSTILNIIHGMFKPYCSVFNAKDIVSSSSFPLQAFSSNPLIAIQHDGDLSKIESNGVLNSVISHETVFMNEKNKSPYSMKMNSYLFMGTNNPVKISDSKSGLLRRLIDITPNGNTIPIRRYEKLIKDVVFEYGAIAFHCLNVYNKLGKSYYINYKAKGMMEQTNVMYNFVDENRFIFKDQEYVTLSQAYSLYKEYCEASMVAYKMSKMYFKEELKQYFRFYSDYAHDTKDNRRTLRNIYKDLIIEKFETQKGTIVPKDIYEIKETDISKFDDYCKDCKAQYGDVTTEAPIFKWDNVKTYLKDIDPTKLHYVQVPNNHIVIDFDLKDGDGNKSKERNLEAASSWPTTYAEYSKSGAGVHLHYLYEGDTSMLNPIFQDGIEIKVFKGNASLRRKLSFHNGEDIKILPVGSLPLKEEKKVVSENHIQTERGLRKMVERNLAKEFHAGTKPSIDFIDKILTDAYNSDMKYDISDMRNKVLQFAMKSTNQSDYCVNLVNQMKFTSKQESSSVDVSDTDEIIFYDVEVFPNLFVVVYKADGEDKQPVIMINPSALDIEQLLKLKLVGFNCRRYDNHILYARYLGYTNEQLYDLSQKIISDHGGFFREAYNISYTDIYDFSNTKQSLKKWEIELGFHHLELGLPWDQPVPEDIWEKVAVYCINDVIATEKLFHHLKADWTARQILAKISDGSVNDTTNQLATKFIFGNDKHPNLQYTQMETIFPGYELRNEIGPDGKSHLCNWYRDVDLGFGGYVYANHGVYYDVALLDVASMHPTSLILLNYFGDYTPKFKDILDARLAIKNERYDEARNLMGGALQPYLEDETQTEALAYALKIVINSQYGLSSSRYDVPQRDVRNVNNIVALRGALFMKTLQDEVTKQGYKVIHIKTDSIKIANATKEIIGFCMEFAQCYGYTFEHEATYEKICLITDADYVAKCSWAKNPKKIGQWTATGAQFAHPFVFKKLFSRKPILFEDLCETKSVKTALYLDMNESLPEGEHNYQFVGRVGQFCPILEGRGGGELLSQRGEKYAAVTGTKGYRWLESEYVKVNDKLDDINGAYFLKMSDEMFTRIGEYTDAETFCSNNPSQVGDEIYEINRDNPPMMECGAENCDGCRNLKQDQYHSDCLQKFDNTDYILSKGE